MPQSLSTYTQAHKDDAQVKYVLCLSLFMNASAQDDVADDETYNLVMWNEAINIYHGGVAEQYVPYPFDISTIKEDGATRTVSVTFANVYTKELEKDSAPLAFFPFSILHINKIAEDSHGLVNKKIRVFKVMLDDLVSGKINYETAAFEIREFYIKQISNINLKTITVNCVDDLFINNKTVPYRTHSARCMWRYSQEEANWFLFGGGECPFNKLRIIRFNYGTWNGINLKIDKKKILLKGETSGAIGEFICLTLNETIGVTYNNYAMMMLTDTEFQTGEYMFQIDWPSDTYTGAEARMQIDEVIESLQTNCNKIYDDGTNTYDCAFKNFTGNDMNTLINMVFGGFDE